MDFNIDEYKINGNKIYIKGWAHYDKYKIEVVSEKETKIIEKYEPRYDICMQFHEKIDENNYGFKDEVIFSKKINIVDIYLISKNEKILIKKIDERKILKFFFKIRKILGKIKRGIKFLWREYHFLVPPAMIKKYIKMIFKKEKKQETYNPKITSEYNFWLEIQEYNKIEKQNIKLDNVTFLSNFENENIDVIISNNFNEVIKKVKTDYVCLINGKIDFNKNFSSIIDDILKNEDNDLIYFDNDIIIDETYQKPCLKTDWAVDTLLGINYIGNCFIIKKKLIKNQKSFDLYEILLNLINKKITVKHIPKILYHDYKSVENGKTEVEKYLKSNNIKAKVNLNLDKITNTIIYDVDDSDMVSIIIPTKDHDDLLKKCLDSIYEKTLYKNYEIIVIDNNSSEQETFDLLEEYSKKYSNFNYKRIECEFNYSYINNEAVKLSKGEYILLLNNDIEVITPEWLEYMLGYAKQSHVGTVGAKLLFPDDTIQHAGIIVGKGGLAGHAHYSKPRNEESFNYELSIPYNYSACTAACLMIKKSVFLSVGGLEEKLKVAFNDVDLNLKILDKGYYNVFLPNVELYHYESKSRGLDTSVEKQKRFIQEWSFMKDKWEKYIEHDKYYNDNFSKNEDYMLK